MQGTRRQRTLDQPPGDETWWHPERRRCDCALPRWGTPLGRVVRGCRLLPPSQYATLRVPRLLNLIVLAFVIRMALGSPPSPWHPHPTPLQTPLRTAPASRTPLQPQTPRARSPFPHRSAHLACRALWQLNRWLRAMKRLRRRERVPAASHQCHHRHRHHARRMRSRHRGLDSYLPRTATMRGSPPARLKMCSCLPAAAACRRARTTSIYMCASCGRVV